MQPLLCNVATLAVVTLYYVYKSHLVLRLRKQRQLRARVAYMLWAMAQQVDERNPSVSTS